ncbi:hypothetical protein [Glaciecola sp. 1036]|uniref:hypothetical protein n=1 Tax=Alteromonadaceae TaxID=72275 RepID=UPI003D073E16
MVITIKRLSLVFGLAFLTQAQAIELADLRTKVQERNTQLVTSEPALGQKYQTSIFKWLSGPPSVQFQAMKSNMALGSDEYEVGISLPFNSPSALQLQEKQRQLDSQIQHIQDQQLRLFYSGLLRQVLWQRLLAQQEEKIALDKRQWMSDILADLQTQTRAGELSEYALLLWQQRHIQSQISYAKAKSELDAAINYYQSVTGTTELPEHYVETSVIESNQRWHSHPQLQMLSLTRQQANLAYALSDAKQTPWTLQILARQLRGPFQTENLLGVAIDIPLTWGSQNTLSNHIEWRQTIQEIEQMTAQAYTQIRQQYLDSQSQLVFLQHKNELLEQQAGIAEKITQHLQLLTRNNEVEQGSLLLELINQREISYQFSKNQLLQAQQISILNQISGQAL